MIYGVLDPGHYEKVNQGIIPEYWESEMNLKLSKMEAAELRKYGIDVVLTREGTGDLSLTTRGRKAANKDFFISNHSNAASTPSATGVSVFYSTDLPGTRGLAEKLGKKVSEILGTYFRGAFVRLAGSGNYDPDGNGEDYYTVIDSSQDAKCRACFIVEHGFHTNMHDCTMLMNDAVLQKLAIEESKIIAEYYGLSQSVQPPPVITPDVPAISYTEHIFKDDESLYRLGKLYNMDWNLFKRKDGKPLDPQAMHDGDILLIPGESKYFEHVYREGETLYRLGINNKIDWQLIIRKDGLLIEPTKLRDGTVLLIPRVEDK